MPPARWPARVIAAVALALATATALSAAAWPGRAAADDRDSAALQIGSKRFTESYILGEILSQAVRGAGGRAEHRQGLGNTAIVLGALQSGSIDLYPEYTGTIAREVLKLEAVPDRATLNARLAPMGLAASVPLGFSNGYALAMRADDARDRGVSTLGGLAGQPSLRLGLTQEFIGRADGWAGLKAHYDLPFATPRGLDHGIAYEALAQRQVDVIDVYTTDAKIDRYGLVVLADDRHFFPGYDAVLLHRADLPQRAPQAWKALQALSGKLDEATMRRLNAEAELDRRPFAEVARDWLAQAPAKASSGPAPASASGRTPDATSGGGFVDRLLADDLPRLTLEHLVLVFGSLAASMAIGIPLGVVASRIPRLSAPLLGAVGVVQTIPSLALLAFLIPLTGRIGLVPAFAALVLYALLPIVQNTHTGLREVPGGISEAARSLGLSRTQVLRLVELPMARPTILAGIKTSAVINVGTATIAAFIGAGGYGERIVTGLALNDHATMLAGAVPAAVMALLIDRVFGWIERRERWRRAGAASPDGRDRPGPAPARPAAGAIE